MSVTLSELTREESRSVHYYQLIINTFREENRTALLSINN